MDETDERIIRILKNHGRATYSHIGKKVNLSEGAVRKRIKALVNSGVIKQFTVEVQLSKSTKAITLLSIDPSFPTQNVSKTLRSFANIETIYEITGQHDIAVIISGLNIGEVDDCLEKIRRVEGVTDTHTMIVLRTW